MINYTVFRTDGKGGRIFEFSQPIRQQDQCFPHAMREKIHIFPGQEVTIHRLSNKYKRKRKVDAVLKLVPGKSNSGQ